MTTAKINQSWQFNRLEQQQSASILRGYPLWETPQREALSLFERQGFPHRKMEQWKYTNLTALVQSAFALNKAIQTTIHLPTETAFYSAHFVDGVWQNHSVSLPKAVVMTDLRSMLNTTLDFTLPAAYQTMFSHLNLALMSNGLFLSIPKNTVLDKPIHLHYHNAENGLMHHPRHVIFLEENAEVTLIEEYTGEQSYFNNIVTQIVLGHNAKLNYIKLQRESKTAFHLANAVVYLGQNAAIEACHIGVGGKIAREDINLLLENKGANAALYGLYSPTANQLMDYHTRLDHAVEQTHSQQWYKGIVDGKARAVFNGKVVVSPKAQKITAHQKNANLLLSQQAEVDTKPELEIYADDVQCSHGATVGHLDEKALFYLQSRGISKTAAQRILLNAFSDDIIHQIKNEAVLNYVKTCLAGESHV